MNDNCEHEWIVFSTCLGTIEIMCECVRCGAFGVVPDSTTNEWSEAFYAPSRPYRWTSVSSSRRAAQGGRIM